MRNRPTRRSERGIIVVMAGVGLVVTLFFVGLFADLGLAFVTKARLSKAVDAGALAAARNTAAGTAGMRTLATQVASANYGLKTGTYDVQIDTQSVDTTKVTLIASTEIDTLLARVMGPKTISMRALGEATRFPLDLSILLDVSMSLERNDAFDDMQVAAKAFVARFDPAIDQVGLVQFSTVANELLQVKKNFAVTAPAAIDALVPIADTDIEEGLRVSAAQLAAAPLRNKAIKVIVLFTDGRPTAFRDDFHLANNPPGHYDGVVSAYISGSSARGLFEPLAGLKITQFVAGLPILVPNLDSASSQDMPTSLPHGLAVNGDNIRATGMSQAEEQADDARKDGYRIYVVGLGNPAATDPLDTPDLDLLRRLANEDGRVDPNQPEGTMLFAPSAAELVPVFSQLADRILTRLTR